MLTNKWLLFALTGLGILVPDLLALPWANVVDPVTAAKITAAGGFILAFLHAIMPPASQDKITSTGGSIFTHTAFAVLGVLLLGVMVTVASGGSAFAMGTSPGGPVVDGAALMRLVALVALLVTFAAILVRGFRGFLIAGTLGLCVATSGCAAFNTLAGSTISPKAAYTSITAANTAIQGATVYLRLPLCSATVTAACRTQSGSQTLYDDMTAVQTSRNGLLALLRQNNGAAIPVASYNTLQTAVSTLTTALGQLQAPKS